MVTCPYYDSNPSEWRKLVLTGKLIIVIGVVLVLIGLALTYAPWLVNWFGKLPGDIRIQNEKSVVFVPLMSMLLISVILSLIINIFFRK